MCGCETLEERSQAMTLGATLFSTLFLASGSAPISDLWPPRAEEKLSSLDPRERTWSYAATWPSSNRKGSTRLAGSVHCTPPQPIKLLGFEGFRCSSREPFLLVQRDYSESCRDQTAHHSVEEHPTRKSGSPHAQKNCAQVSANTSLFDD